MSEPTPLSAEELAWACDNFSPHAMEGMAFRELREARAKIAALRGALEREKRSEWREGLVAVIDHEGNYLGCMGTMTWAVLAVKEVRP